MFTANYFLRDKKIGSENFSTIEEAENKYEESDYFNKADRYEITDSETDEIIDEGEIVDPDDIIEDMFDGEDSKEGFDWTLGD